ncbi:hypothetical protein D3C84_604630 [compost metagenome]
MAQLLRRLLQRLGGHKGMCDPGRASSDGDDPGAALDRGRWRFCDRLINLSLFRRLTEKVLGIAQGLGRRALEQALTGKTLQVQRAAADHQHPVGGSDHRRRQLPLGLPRIMHFNTGAPAQTLRGGVQQARTEHTGNLAVGAGGDDGNVHLQPSCCSSPRRTSCCSCASCARSLMPKPIWVTA